MMKKKQGKRLAVTATLLIFLSSCYVGRQYQRPELNTDDLYRTDALVDSAYLEMDSVSMADLSWQNLFADPLLKQYIQTGLTNNIDIRIALKNIDIANAYLKQAGAAFGPSVYANLNYGIAHNSKNGGAAVTDVNQFQLGANLSWEADIWGKLKSGERAASANYLQTVEAHKAVKTRLVANIASLYYQLGAISDQVSIAQETIVSRDSSLITTKALKVAGQVTEVAVKQTEAQLYDAQLILVNLREQERSLENAFCMLLNEPPHSIDRNALSQQEINTPLRTGVAAQLLANRPDVRQAEYGLIYAFELTNVAKSNFYPSLTISAGAGLQSLDIKNWLDINSLFANITGGLLQPITNRRQIKTAYAVSQMQQEQALLNYEQILLQAGNEVSNALFDYQSQTKTIDLEKKKYDAYKTAVNYSEQLLINGLANYLEVLTARQNALATQLNLVNTRYAQLQSIVNLYEALGGGWQ